MIRDVVLHIHNDQPMLCDIEALPKPSDSAIVCTNLRSVDGKKPVFIERTDSWFVFPLGVIRFVEVLRHSLGPGETGEDFAAITAGAGQAGLADDDLFPEVEPDEDLLRRVRDA
jgi:hypothetical protein